MTFRNGKWLENVHFFLWCGFRFLNRIYLKVDKRNIIFSEFFKLQLNNINTILTIYFATKS